MDDKKKALNDTDKKKIGRRIAHSREKNVMTQESFAEEIGLTTGHLSKIERGEKIPSLDRFIVIANALGESADLLLSDVLNCGYKVQTSVLTEKIAKLTPENRQKLLEIVEVMLK